MSWCQKIKLSEGTGGGEFKADIVMDKTGVQEKKFTEGEHNVAVQAVDKKGLSGADKVKIDAKSKKK